MRKTPSPILAAVHDTAKGLFQAGAMDQTTLREFDQLCLPPVEPLLPEQQRKGYIPQAHCTSGANPALTAPSAQTRPSPSIRGCR